MLTMPSGNYMQLAVLKVYRNGSHEGIPRWLSRWLSYSPVRKRVFSGTELNEGIYWLERDYTGKSRSPAGTILLPHH